MTDAHHLLIDLHRDGERQGPGGDDQTVRALELAAVDRSAPLRVADLGCGTGAATRVLARELHGEILAVDTAGPFLGELRDAASRERWPASVTTLECSMDALPFDDGALDVIWSEGAIYNMGFTAGVAAWRRYLKPGGTLAVSEITWLTGERPAALHEHWTGEYPEIDVASAKIRVLEEHGYRPEGYFVLPAHCWLENYYRPLESRFDAFLARHDHSPAARAIVAAERHEIDLHLQYGEYVGYGFYVASRAAG